MIIGLEVHVKGYTSIVDFYYTVYQLQFLLHQSQTYMKAFN